MFGFSVPPQLILGQSASLKCSFDLEGSKLYSVKWYKNGQEFYRYMPAMERQYDVFDVAGVNIDVSIFKLPER
jgi:hypothetical protein